MSERKSSDGLKAFVLVVLATGLGVVASGGFMVLGWKLAGSPDAEALDEMKCKWLASMDEEEADGVGLSPAGPAASPGAAGSGGRSVLASAPIEATEAIYQKYMAREDVLVLVEYYADW